MCGIIGYTGTESAVPIVLEGLRKLESRGYDSTGIATMNYGARMIITRKRTGKLENLLAWIEHAPLGETTIALGHNRWATHGGVTETNAHPHVVNDIAVVHNGIIENHLELRKYLEEERAREFSSETDTEVIPQLINLYIGEGYKILNAIRKTAAHLRGSYALGIMFAREPGTLYAVRSHQPLILGFGTAGSFMSSSELAIASVAHQVVHLNDRDIAKITATGAVIWDIDGKEVKRDIKPISMKNVSATKGNFRHYLLKEIHEQPGAVGDTVRSLSDPNTHTISLPKLPFNFKEVERLTIVACGTAAHAGLIARYWFEEFAGLPVDWDIASEFCYRSPVLTNKTAGLFLSQSGETKDSISALEYMKEKGCPTLAILNAPESSMARIADGVIYTSAYPEISVASTKAFTTQLTVLAYLVLGAALERTNISKERFPENIEEKKRAFDQLPAVMYSVLAQEKQISEIAKEIAEAKDVFFVGRSTNYCIALEGALKLKEVSYIHAEGYPAGELKHGPLALIDRSVPTIAIAPSDKHFEKTASNLQEIAARGGKVILLSDEVGCEKLRSQVYKTVTLPTVDPFVTPILYSLPVQLLAYYTAVHKGTDVDNPRNLAKSVTTE